MVLERSDFAAEVLARGLRTQRLVAVAGRWTGTSREPCPLVLLDGDGPAHDALAALDRHAGATTRAVLMTRGQPPVELPGAPRVCGAVSRSQTVQHVAGVLRRVLQGLPVPEFVSDARAAVRSPLTEREVEVLVQLAQGVRNDDIASSLCISPHTARTHVQNILTKLGVDNRLEAAVVARREGLLPRATAVCS